MTYINYNVQLYGALYETFHKLSVKKYHYRMIETAVKSNLLIYHVSLQQTHDHYCYLCFH